MPGEDDRESLLAERPCLSEERHDGWSSVVLRGLSRGFGDFDWVQAILHVHAQACVGITPKMSTLCAAREDSGKAYGQDTCYRAPSNMNIIQGRSRNGGSELQ